MALSFYADGRLIKAEAEETLLSAGLKAQLDIPYFCWHPAMGAVGSCRQCAVKIFQGPTDDKGQIAMACMTKPTPGMRISVDDPEAVKFRAAVVEMVLTNHPHDCPVCEVAGECHLQDMTVLTGHHERRYKFPKRTHLNQNLGPLIRHEMNRCIGCYRCVRFYRDYAGGDDFGVFGAHRNIYFGRAEDGPLLSQFAGNLIEVCPTGVFVDKPFSATFRRKWDMRATPSICPHCAVGCNTTINERDGQFKRVMNRYNETLNGYFLCDRGRFGSGFLNSPARLRSAHDRAGNVLTMSAARARLAMILTEGNVIGIGSARASFESNFALADLVGAPNFFAGYSDFEAAAMTESIKIMRHIRPATLQQIEQADAFLLLGDDPALVAPRLALALRQAARQGQPIAGDAKQFMTATTAPGWLDRVATRVNIGAPHAFVMALIRDVAGTVAARLLAAERPVIVAGGDASLLAHSANLVLALRRRGIAAQLSLLVPEANSVGLGLLDCRSLAAAASAVAGKHVIVLERDIAREMATATDIFAAAKSVIVLDHITTTATRNSDLAIGIASFAESDGLFVNFEGRVQRFSKAIWAENNTQASWQVLRDAAIEAGHFEAGRWQTHAALLADMAKQIPALAPCLGAGMDGGTSHSASLPYRYSGSAAGLVNAEMDSGTAIFPAAPGWNSVQVLQRGPLPDLRDWFVFSNCQTKAFETREPALADDRRIGVEELSQLSPAINAYQEAVGK